MHYITTLTPILLLNFPNIVTKFRWLIKLAFMVFSFSTKFLYYLVFSCLKNISFHKFLWLDIKYFLCIFSSSFWKIKFYNFPSHIFCILFLIFSLYLQSNVFFVIFFFLYSTFQSKKNLSPDLFYSFIFALMPVIWVEYLSRYGCFRQFLINSWYPPLL